MLAPLLDAAQQSDKRNNAGEWGVSKRHDTWRDPSGHWTADLQRRELLCDGVVVRLGDRAFEVLACLLQAGGRMVTKEELIEAIWPGAIVEENTLHAQIVAVRRALGASRVALQTVFGRGYRILPAWLPSTPDARPAAATEIRPRRKPLPLPTAELIGRAATIADLLPLLAAHRVVTLTGTGGIGKTALALTAARSSGTDAALVELAVLSNPALIAAAVVQALGLELAPDAIDMPRLLRAIGGNHILLLIDNCEHLIDAVAALVEAVVAGCPHVTVLATSREALRVGGEAVYRVPPLDVPQEGAPDALAHGAVQLLLARMRALGAAAPPGEAELAAAAAVCRRLDGIPLAIEFAAAHAAELGLRQVATHLVDRLELLGGGRRTALPRQQTLRAAFDWSYDFLSPAERTVLRRLGVFVGSFTLNAAAAVASGIGEAPAATIECVANLVAKSLVSVDGDGSDRRFRLLETTRAFVLTRLAEAGERTEAERRHAEYYRALFASAADPGPHDDPYATYAAEIDNVRAALDWALFSDGDGAIGVALAAALTPLWVRLSLMAEATRYVRQALASLDQRPAPDPRIKMVLNAAFAAALTYTTGPRPEILAAWSTALRLAQEASDIEYTLRALRGLWSYHMNRGEYRSALALADQFCEFAERHADAMTLRAGNRMAGLILHYLGEQAEARRRIEPGMSAPDTPPHPLPMTRFMLDESVAAKALLARISWLQGFPARATQEANDALRQAQLSGHALSQCHALAQAACPVSLWTGDFGAMDHFTAMLIELASRNALDGWIARGRCFRGTLLIMRGDLHEGTDLLRSALRELRLQGSVAEYPAFQCGLARGLALAGEVQQGLDMIDEALLHSENIEESWCFAELLRTKGQILQLGSVPNIAVAEEAIRQSLEVARRQGALSLELRAATALVRLRREERGPLADAYSKFSEGFETADVRAAQELLEGSS